MKFYILLVLMLVVTTVFLVMHTSATQLQRAQAKLDEQTRREDEMTYSKQDFTAHYLIFTNGTQRILTGRRYYLQSPDVYLTSQSPTTLHLRKKGVTWEMFFKSISLNLNSTCLVISEQQQFCANGANQLRFYINGVKVSDFFTREIHDGDRAMISFGSENRNEILEQLTKLDQLQ